ncbi:cysteine-rich receptor-like protein kinase 10 [Macadamia integrifolia]|uniref:cysteine-rich receptor-like protein kinase 10 n=1 Tax=Macadamia integrifolia TaxID=60698 RepID=UPI001C53367F|nr:cysteine-rich receptor-like protein kinase 10 [Macadamia integrifolia]
MDEEKPTIFVRTNTASRPTVMVVLNILLSFLSSNATSTSNNAYHNATVGQSPNTVYGLYYCRGDVARDVCRDCVNSAVNDIVKSCPNGEVGVIWYDECTLRYSNESIFSIVSDSSALIMLNPNNISDPTRFNQLLDNTMNEVATEAASYSDRFATQEAIVTEFQNLYCLAQCSPYLSRNGCYRCLLGAIGNLPICCNGSQGGRVFSPSCVVRFEMYLFHRVTTSVPATSSTLLVSGRNTIISAESLQFDFSVVLEATYNLADVNKIGEGGFGSVYKGMLPNGQEIAVKRLSRNSSQGVEEFKNEVVLVAKLQHCNFVRLLGFCLEGEEKILIYEFVSNKSLDYFLFDDEKHVQLDWQRRYKIIQGIARGFLYLHEDSCLRIIHRDLKASNILLDEEMNPKISDFGIARIFGMDQTQEKTNRIVGTYGYMSREYALHGFFSVKSDVFSFSVLILEIVSGKKNSIFHQTDSVDLGLKSNAWRHWNAGTTLELIDPILLENCSISAVMRCIHIGLLCVQKVDERPTMANMVLMLNGYPATLPLPTQPASFVRSSTGSRMLLEGKVSQETGSSQCKSMSITEVQPR